MLAQLRDVLTAKNSSIVTKKHDDRGLAFPQRSQADFLPVGVRENNVGEFVAESFLHVDSLLHGAGDKYPYRRRAADYARHCFSFFGTLWSRYVQRIAAQDAKKRSFRSRHGFRLS
jgi:hypothetical protein